MLTEGPRPQRVRRVAPALVALFVVAASPASGQRAAARPAAEALPTVAAKVAGLEARDGVLDFHVDTRAGKVWLEVPPPTGPRGVCVELLHLEGLARGLGSNPVGLDRGQMGDSRLLVIRRAGPRVLFEQPNLAFRALTENADERRATEESFATSVLWGAEIAALDRDGRTLVDFTPFLLRDAHGVVATLRATGQGDFTIDASRSTVEWADCLAFPDNVEFEATLTFESKQPGGEVRATTPTPEAVTIVQHLSFVRLPAAGYRPREADPRVGTFAVRFSDRAAPLGGTLDRAWVTRFRLEKTHPAAAQSPVKKPIVFYVDRGAPDAVREALIEGAGWWAAAFERAGFVDAYRVEELPEGAHPLDVRYNVIQWVHRATRGWSYGNAIVDPRTGEILKGHVSLGSLRVRHDIRLFEGLAGTAGTGRGGPDDPVVLSLQRIRQLSAHEVGHALGIAHNFAASTYGRASVMDYPAPWVDVSAGGDLDFSRAYGEGAGAWDDHAIRYAYGTPAAGEDEEAWRLRVVRDGIEGGLLFLSDDDARPLGASDARASLWDNGDDPVAELDRTLKVRRAALDRFGERNVAPGRPLAELQDVFALTYLHHRYQLECAVKEVGGLRYQYALRGDGQSGPTVVDAARQRAALAAVLRIVDPAALDVPEPVLALLAPPVYGTERSREWLATGAAPSFDALGAASTATAHAVEALIEPRRLARVIDAHRRDPVQLGPAELLRALLDRALPARPPGDRRLAAVSRAIARATVDAMLETAAARDTPPAVRAHLESALRDAATRLRARGTRGEDGIESRALAESIDRWFARPGGPPAAPAAAAMPLGPPIMPEGLDACGAATQ